MKLLINSVAALTLSISFAHASSMSFQFSSPSFSGSGYAAHVLAIKQLEDQAKQKIKDQEALAKAEQERIQLNNPVNKFVANLEGMVFQQLAKQISDNLFGDAGKTSGVVTLPGGATITWNKVGENINLQINDHGNLTTVTVPVGSFFF